LTLRFSQDRLAGFEVETILGQAVKDRDRHPVRDGDKSFLFSFATQSPEQVAKLTLPGFGGGPCAFDQRGPQPAISARATRGATLSAADVVGWLIRSAGGPLAAWRPAPLREALRMASSGDQIASK